MKKAIAMHVRKNGRGMDQICFIRWVGGGPGLFQTDAIGARIFSEDPLIDMDHLWCDFGQGTGLTSASSQANLAAFGVAQP